MKLSQLIDAILAKGIPAAKTDYADSPQKAAGAVAGFEACRGKSPNELRDLLAAARTATQAAYFDDDKDNYWWYRCYEAEVEWVCNVVSCALVNSGLEPIVPPTCRGMMMAAEIIGVRESA
jgi:hypothetical protein